MRSTLRRSLATAAVVAALPATASADLSAWLAAVASGTPATFVDSSVIAPDMADIGMTSGTNGVTYEFVVNATNAGASSGLMGARNTGTGASSGLKFEQWQDSMQYGVTEFGIVDLYYPGNNVESTDVHLVFLADTTAGSTELYVDGVSVGSLPHAPVLQGMQGLGQIYDPNTGGFDILTGTLHGVAVYEGLMSVTEILAHRDAYFGGGIGTLYCSPAVANSTGVPGVISAVGSDVAASNDFTLLADQLPTNQFGYFIAGQTSAFIPNPGGSQGILCIATPIARIISSLQSSGASGSMMHMVDLTAIPLTPPVAVMAGDTWNFQGWYRDVNPTATSNFTDALEVIFQ